MRSRDPFGRALAEIRGRIRSGAVLPGQPLIVDDLARDLRLSPTPVREALAFLDGEGLIVGRAIAGRGYVASSLTATELGDLYRFHANQVVFAIAEAARRGQRAAMTEGEAGEAKDLAERAGALFARLVRAGGNLPLLRTHLALAHRLHRARIVEPRVLEGVEAELRDLATSGPGLVGAVRRYHRRRIAAREEIARLAAEAAATGPEI